MTRLLRQVFRACAGCVLVFLTVVCLATLVQMPLAFDQRAIVIPLAGGFAGGLVCFTFISHLPWFYVCGHELTHWLTAKLFLRETGKLEVGRAGGHVQVERPNIWIVLAPYFIPVYSLVWTGFYGIGKLIWPATPDWATIVFNVGLGATYAYHVRMTVYALGRSQNDLRLHGAFLSLALILCCNATLVLVCLAAAGGQWLRGYRLFQENLAAYAAFIWGAADWLVHALRRLHSSVWT